MPDTEQTGAGQPAETEPMDAETARRVERDRLTRRAALRKLGFGAGIAALSLFSVDDLARLVGARMERMAGDNKIAAQVAKEFRRAGVVLAGSPSGPGSSTCQGCVDTKMAAYTAAYNEYEQCLGDCAESWGPVDQWPGNQISPSEARDIRSCDAICDSNYSFEKNQALLKAGICCDQNGCNCGQATD